MMNTEEQELARRCVAHPAWDWRPGMAKSDPVTGVRWRMLSGGVWIYDGGQIVDGSEQGVANSLQRANVVGPDLGDAATVGALIVVRGLSAVQETSGRWTVSCPQVHTFCTYADTLGVAVATAWLYVQNLTHGFACRL